MAVDFETLVDRYVELLGIQYRTQPNARSLVASAVRAALADGVPLQLSDGFNLDTAAGPQLDILAKYIGVERGVLTTINADYFGFRDDDSGVTINNNGFQDDGPGYLPIGMIGSDNFNSYPDGVLASPSMGIGWAGNGLASVPETMGHDNFDAYADGALTNPSLGDGWAGYGNASVPN